ncbi:MAG: hypothetical protein IJ727_03855 [Treponema sp.]|nr:hypothetical protein [Treponema sp.]
MSDEIEDSKIGKVDETKTPESHLGYADAKLAWNQDTWNVEIRLLGIRPTRLMFLQLSLNWSNSFAF